MIERDIFLALLDLPDPAARSAYLAKACAGDAALRAQVDSLLRSHDNAGNFLSKPAVPAVPLADGETPRELAATLVSDGRAAEGANDLSFLAASPRPGSLGRLGHYEVLDVLGRGGFGIVFRAFDETLERLVAIKVLAPHLAVTASGRKRFLREARSSAQIRHENVVQVYAIEEDPVPYLVMEFVPGETLQERLDRLGPLEVPEVVRLGRQIAAGLAAAHATGLIHRDVKPANILLETSGVVSGGVVTGVKAAADQSPVTTHHSPLTKVKVTDFGLARAADDASLSQSGLIGGTPMYMAPEQASADPLDHRADLFSLGSVLYAMCTGRPPFRARTTLALLKRLADDTPRPIREIRPDVPPWLCALISRLHAKEPADRFASAQEVADLLAQQLAALQHPGNVPASQETPVGHVSSVPSARHVGNVPHPTCRWAAAAAVLLMLLGGIAFTEATGVTNFRGTVIRLFSPEGTLVVEVDDPGVSVKIDGLDLVITGAGTKEIRLRPGRYQVEARKDGKVVRQELVTVTKNGRQVVRVSQEPLSAAAKAAKAADDAAAWERAVAGLSADQRVKAVRARLRALNPDFDGKVVPTIENDVVTGLAFSTEQVSDISPVRACTKLKNLQCNAGVLGASRVKDLSPLKGMRLHSLELLNSPLLRDLTPLQGMPLASLQLSASPVQDLTPLQGMPLASLQLSASPVQDLTPLEGMPLRSLNLNGCDLVKDLTPLKGLPLTSLILSHCHQVQDLSPLKGLSFTLLFVDDTPVRDLEPLKDMPLRRLQVDATGVTDLRPLQGTPLEDIRLTPKHVTQGLNLLRSMESLKTIGLNHYQAWPAAEFWARYAKGQFKD
jgi:serine/threonine protein kinase